MVGTRGSGNPRPSNSVRLCLTAELQDFLASLPNEKGIPTEYMILQGFLKHYKAELVGKLGEEKYAELCERYNRNRQEMAKDKQHRLAEAEKRRRGRLKIKKQELELKKKELELREQNLNSQSERRVKAEIEELEENVLILDNQIRKLDAMPHGVYSDEKKDKMTQDLTIERDTLKHKIEELKNNG